MTPITLTSISCDFFPPFFRLHCAGMLFCIGYLMTLSLSRLGTSNDGMPDEFERT
jgi:hypothetical protein